MIYVHFFIKFVVKWSENSVRFELYSLPDGPNSVYNFFHSERGSNSGSLVPETSLFLTRQFSYESPGIAEFYIINTFRSFWLYCGQ